MEYSNMELELLQFSEYVCGAEAQRKGGKGMHAYYLAGGRATLTAAEYYKR